MLGADGKPSADRSIDGRDRMRAIALTTSDERPTTIRVPGRVNLIGEHTDHSGGLALPFATDRALWLSVRRHQLGTLRITSRTTGECVALTALDVDSEGASDERPLSLQRTAVACCEVARELGVARAAGTVEIAGDLPIGAGLSSSAALCLGLIVAVCVLGGHLPGDPLAVARAAARAERAAGGAGAGLLDQVAILGGAPGAGVLCDFAADRYLRVDIALEDARLALLDSGERRALGSSPYAARVAECAEAARMLGVAPLAKAPLDSCLRLPNPWRKRATHVVAECERVRLAVDALRRGDTGRLGRLLDASHRSLRDLFDVSTPAVEHTRALAKAHGALGARLVGGGFGGMVLALFPADAALPTGALPVRPDFGLTIDGTAPWPRFC